MITFERVSFTYPDAPQPVLRDVDLVVPEGELCLVLGGSGSGKSTLLRAVNGLVPRFSGGRLTGSVRVAGRSTAEVAPRDLADVVGYVGQDPLGGFVTDTVEDELAYAMENLGVAPDAMRRRVEDVLDLLSLHPVRNRPLRSLSGGQQQRVAIGSVLTAGPRVLVLDEPTSALDPSAAEDVLAALARLVHDLGVTVLLAEHRLERVVQFADRVVFVPGGGRPVVSGPPAEVLATATVAPPVVRLGRLAGWDPLPLSIRDARRRSPELQERLAPRAVDALGRSARRGVGVGVGVGATGLAGGAGGTGGATGGTTGLAGADGSGSGAGGSGAGGSGAGGAGAGGAVVGRVERLAASYGPVPALRRVDLELRAGEVVALMGRNGSGKSTLLAHLAGLRRPPRGRVEVAGQDPAALDAAAARSVVGFVPQDPALLLWRQRVDDELAAADGETGAEPGTARALLDRLVAGIDDAAHPRDLSEGQRLALVLAVVLAASPSLVLLDEPTRGLDEQAKAELACVLHGLAAEGRCVVLATHDVEVVAVVADRAVVLAEGEVVADGPARDVVSHSPVFAPQVAKVLSPQPWLTVAEVERALSTIQVGSSPDPVEGPAGGAAGAREGVAASVGPAVGGAAGADARHGTAREVAPDTGWATNAGGRADAVDVAAGAAASAGGSDLDDGGTG